MINRSVIGKRAKGTQPISQDQLSTLKQKAIRVDEIEGRGNLSIWDYVCDFWTMVTHAFAPKDRQCNIYGHTMSTDGWSMGRLPKCGDCGIEISHPSDLRRALPREY